MVLFDRKGVALILGACFMAGTVISPAFAQEAAREFSQAAGAVVNRSMELVDDEKIEAALDDLQGLIGKADLNAYERATIYQMIGQYSYELDRVEESQHAFENALLYSEGLFPSEIDNLKVVIAQLMISNGQYREGAERLENYLASGGSQKSEYIDLLVNARVQGEDYAGALPWAEKWFQAAAPKQRKHYDLLNFLYNNLAMKEQQIDLVKEMIDRWPDDKNLWGAWSSILANSGRENESFEVHKMMYQAGLLTEAKELKTLVQYYDFYDMPFQAAEILEREIEIGRISETANNLKQTASLFQQARVTERAVPYLEKAAALTNDARLKIEIAENLARTAACEKAETVIMSAYEKGYDKTKGYMLIGNCYSDLSAKLDNLSCNLTEAQKESAPKSIARFAALKTFKAVPETSSESGNAKKWIQFIEAEIQADKRRCDHGHHRQPDLCYQKIKQTYDAAIFTDGFKLEGESCRKYIPDYNAKFRPGLSEK